MTIQDQAKQLKKDIKQFVNGGYVWISKIKAQKWTGGGEYYKVAFQTTAKDSKNEDLITLIINTSRRLGCLLDRI